MRALLAATALLGLAACSSGAVDAAAPPAPLRSGPAASGPGGPASGDRGPGGSDGSGGPAAGTGLSPEAAVQLVRDHLDAVRTKDVDAWAAPLDPDVRFDIGGSIYQGIGAVRDWAVQDPIALGGYYEVVTATPTPTGVSTDLLFRRGSGADELRYVFTIRSGRIADLVARYR